MAGITATMTLIDKMTSPINNIISALNTTVTALETVSMKSGNALDSSAFTSAREEIALAANSLNDMSDNIDKAGQSVQSLTGKVSSLGFNVQNIRNLVSTVTDAIGSITGAADELASNTARLDMMNTEFNKMADAAGSAGMETSELMNMVRASAKDARGSFSDMTAIVARFGNNSKDAFSSQEEVVQFANLVQKQMTIAGASTQEASNAMLQLSQALGSGVLRGDELNSIFEQAPNLIQSIADYMGVGIGQIRSMASDGQITADIVKNAMFASADSINERFENMPATFSQIWQSFKDDALAAFTPVLTRLTAIASNQTFIDMINILGASITIVANQIMEAMDRIGAIAAFVQNNLSVIAPLLIGITAAILAYNLAMTAMSIATKIQTVVQNVMNASLMACPLTWILLAIIAIVAVIFTVANAIAKMTSVANTGFGVITGGISVVGAFFKNLGLSVANIALGIWNALSAVASNIYTAFNNVILSVQSWFYNLLSTVLTVVAGICEALNKIPFVSFDYSGLTDAASDYANKSAEAAASKGEYESVADAFSSGMSTYDAFGDGWVSYAFDAGSAWGDGMADKVTSGISGLLGLGETGEETTSSLFGDSIGASDFGSELLENTGDTAASAAAAADSLETTSDDLEYLKDIAERDIIDRTVFSRIELNVGGITNTVQNGMDLENVGNYIVSVMQNELNMGMEGASASV